ncbi:hypothetical protein FNV43_RR16212 [Rhamnella rubrinervis]|uniref:Uncharacterized protein n=1 Tax=Rhamnella rubrinervis TaxID=2594499 RepID=A0A8K0E4X6_9ROSA|nr:hypothetical protein FNV43_RR16212 [Rhamnella rubrinervis]
MAHTNNASLSTTTPRFILGLRVGDYVFAKSSNTRELNAGSWDLLGRPHRLWVFLDRAYTLQSLGGTNEPGTRFIYAATIIRAFSMIYKAYATFSFKNRPPLSGSDLFLTLPSPTSSL